MFSDRALPDLGKNIRSGNSLVARDIIRSQPELANDPERVAKIKPTAIDQVFPFLTEAGGFDVVLGNPPYVLLEGALRDDLLARYYSEHFKVANYKLDLYHLFIEKSLALTTVDGYCCLITPSNFMTNNYLKPLRQILINDHRIHDLEVLDAAIFEGRSVDTAILLVQAHQPNKRVPFTIRTSESDGAGLVTIDELPLSPAAVRSSPEHLLLAAPSEIVESMAKMESVAAATLGSAATVNFGKQLRDRKVFTEDVIQVESRNAVPTGYAACLNGGDTKRYAIEWGKHACRTTDDARRGGTWDPGVQDAPVKVLCPQIGRWPEWALDDKATQCLNNMFIVLPRSGSEWTPLTLLAVLNSTPLRGYWLGRYWDRRRTFPKIKGTYLKALPLPTLNPADMSRLEDLASTILVSYASTDPQLKSLVQPLEDDIDDLVSQAFDLDASQLASFATYMESTAPQRATTRT